jgi:hypothetical protein
MWFLFTFAVVALLFMFPRQMVRILAGSLAVAAAIGGYFYWEKRQVDEQRSAVSVDVHYDSERCGKAEPLLVTIVNSSSYAVTRVEWVFSARRPGTRAELTGGWLQRHSSDQMIAPGQQYTACYPAPRPGTHATRNFGDDPSQLELGIRSQTITFADD